MSAKKQERRNLIVAKEQIVLLSIILVIGAFVFFVPHALSKYLKKRREQRADREKKLEIVEFFVGQISGDHQFLERARKASCIYQTSIKLCYEVRGEIVSFGSLETVKDVFYRSPRPFMVEFFFHDHTSFEQTVFVGPHFEANGGFWSIGHGLNQRGAGEEYIIVDKAKDCVVFFDDDSASAEVKVLSFVGQYSSVREFLLEKTLLYMRDNMKSRDALELCETMQGLLESSGPIRADLDLATLVTKGAAQRAT